MGGSVLRPFRNAIKYTYPTPEGIPSQPRASHFSRGFSGSFHTSPEVLVRLPRLALALSIVVAAGCGGSSSPNPPPAPPPPPPPPPPPAPVATVLLSPDNATLVPQQTLTIAATTIDATGSLLTGRTISWTSNAATVASVNSSGLVTALTAGTTGIVATSEGKSGTATITVKEGLFVGPGGGQAVGGGGNVTLVIPAGAVTSNVAVTITPFSAVPDSKLLTGTAYEFLPGGTQFSQPVTVRIRYSAGQVPAGTNASLFRLGRLVGNTWTEIPGSSVDLATQTVSGQTTSFSVYGIVLAPAPVASVAISPPTASVGVTSTLQLDATLKDAANNVLSDRVITWTSSNSAIASVNATTGLVTGVAAGGPVTITATSEGVSGTAQVTVTASVNTVTVTPPTTTLQINGTVQLTATLRDAQNNILTDRVVTWTSGSAAIASVSSTGLVTAITSGGPINIIATSEGTSGTAQVTVASAPVATVDLIGSTHVKVGDDYTYVAVAKDAQGNVLDKSVTWSILETAKGNMTSGGQLTPSQTGTITIRMVIDGVNYDRPVTAYSWVVNGTALTLEADFPVSNQSGASELPLLNITCSASVFQVSVTTNGFAIATANVDYTIGGGAKVPDTWVLINGSHGLRHPGATNAAQKAFAQSMTSARIFGFTFVETGGFVRGVLFRTTGLSALLGPLNAACP